MNFFVTILTECKSDENKRLFTIRYGNSMKILVAINRD